MAIDFAYKRVAQLVKVDSGLREPGFNDAFLAIGGTKLTDYLPDWEANLLCDEIREAIATIIREAVLEAEKLAGFALRDMAVDSQQFRLGWEAGATAMRDLVLPPGQAVALWPEPPSHDDESSKIPPLRAYVDRDVLYRTLVEIGVLLQKRHSPTKLEVSILRKIDSALQEVEQ